MPRDNSIDSFDTTGDPELRIIPVTEETKKIEDMNPQQAFAAGEAAGAALKDAPCVITSGRKIAIIGTAPSWQAAPFDDPTWDIWGIFGVSLVSKRLTRLYELHDKSIIEPMVKQFSPDGRYWEVCKKMGKEFYTKDAYDHAPEAQRFDFDGKMKKFGKYFASSAAWMLADAIDQNPAEIAIFGINMAADEEYAHQKPSMSYLIGWAKAKGIKISIPSSSELLSITHQYGLEQPPRFLASLAQRRHECNQQLAVAKSQLLAAQMQCANVEGALSQLQWIEQNFKA